MCVFLKFICIDFFLYYRGPCVRKLFTGLIMYLPSQNNEHCIVLYCIAVVVVLAAGMGLGILPFQTKTDTVDGAQVLVNNSDG